MKRKLSGFLAGALVCTGLLAPSAAQADAPLPIDLCADMDAVRAALLDEGPSGLAWLAGLLGEDAALLAGFNCTDGDLNGPIVDDVPTGNGVLDGNFELAMIGALVNNPASYAGLQAATGLDATAVRAAYQTNYNNIATPQLASLISTTLPVVWGFLQSSVEGVPPLTPGLQATLGNLFPQLARIVAGFATIGDPDSMQIVLFVADLAGFCDLISEGSCLVTPPPTTNPADYDGFPALLAKDADADGDGCSNFGEYTANLANGGAAYVAAVLDPAITPAECGAEGEGEGDTEGETEPGVVSIVGPRQVEVGDSVVLSIVGATGDYSWTKDGDVLSGEDGSSLEFDPVTEGDAGTYVGTVDTGAKAVFSSPPFVLQVFPQGSLPVAGGLGLAVVAGACALAGSTILRRRK